MACRGAQRAVMAQLTDVTVSSEYIFRRINWWTLATIREALEDLIAQNKVRTHLDGFTRKERK